MIKTLEQFFFQRSGTTFLLLAEVKIKISAPLFSRSYFLRRLCHFLKIKGTFFLIKRNIFKIATQLFSLVPNFFFNFPSIELFARDFSRLEIASTFNFSDLAKKLNPKTKKGNITPSHFHSLHLLSYKLYNKLYNTINIL